MVLLGFVQPSEPGEQQAAVMPSVGVCWVPRENRVVAAERLFRSGCVLERERAREERLSLRQI